MVSTSLFTGLAGLKAHQRFIDVIGNNLANVSTPGFWSSRVNFNEILSLTLQSGSGPNNNFGGTNPMQIGLGTQVGSIDVNTAQGTFQDTGRPLDIAIQGRGFFTLNDGTRNVYTRVGTFGIDANRKLVDTRTGFRVQSVNGGDIDVPLTDTLPPQATSRIAFQGNLPATVTGPLAEVVESSVPYMAGTAATKTATPATGTTYDLSAFTGKTLRVSVDGGAQQTVSIPASAFANPAAATASEVAALFGAVSGLTATANGSTGAIDFTTDKLGTGATIKFDDGPSATGVLTALGLDASLTAGTESPATASTDLADLTTRTSPYVNGDQIVITGTNPDGSAVSNTFTYGTDGTTLGDLVAFLGSTFDATQVTPTLAGDGTLRLTATQKQAANLSLSLADATGNTGGSTHPGFAETIAGTGPDTASTSIDVYDSLGRSHSVTLTFTRSTNDPAVWDLTADMDPAEGTISAGTVSGVRFNPDGSFQVVGGGSSTLSFQFNGLAAPQDISVDLGQSGTFSGVRMVGTQTTVAATDQDGYAAGTLLNVGFEDVGNLQGFYSNGQTQALDQLRLTLFPNEAGLLRVGDTMFVESPNSDGAVTVTAGAAGAGSLRPGSLENSNVDMAEEFVQLITAQRGFQANSRVVSTSDEILAELLNIVR